MNVTQQTAATAANIGINPQNLYSYPCRAYRNGAEATED